MWRNRFTRLVSSVLVLGAAAGAGHESPEGHGEEHLERVIASYREGDFEGAWLAYRAFFEHPGKNQVDPHLFARCFGYVNCPAVGTLGSVLGRTADETGPFESFCPRWTASKKRSTAAESAKPHEGLVAAVFGSCERHVQETKSLLPLRSRKARPEPQVVPLRSPPYEPAHPQPHVEIEVQGRPALALLDTGATVSELNRLLTAGDVRLASTLRINRIDGRYEMEIAKLDTLTLHNRTYRDVPASLVNLTWTDSEDPVPPEFGNLIGMDILLRHEATCFDLQGRNLYLGNLGPCEGVKPITQAWLHGSHALYAMVRTSDGHRTPAELDTGSDAFLEANGRNNAFSLHDHATFDMECTHDVGISFPGVASGQRQILIGMDVLGRLDAFGWRLNPLELYFLPADPVAVPDANGGNNENVVTQQKHTDGRGG